jgi:hypothetical protein
MPETAYFSVRYGEIDVCWLPELEGGGRTFGQDYLPVVESLFGRVDRVFELSTRSQRWDADLP